MPDKITCECGNDTFAYLGTRVQCTNCQTQFYGVFQGDRNHVYIKRYNAEKNEYVKNWALFKRMRRTVE